MIRWFGVVVSSVAAMPLLAAAEDAAAPAVVPTASPLAAGTPVYYPAAPWERHGVTVGLELGYGFEVLQVGSRHEPNNGGIWSVQLGYWVRPTTALGLMASTRNLSKSAESVLLVTGDNEPMNATYAFGVQQFVMRRAWLSVHMGAAIVDLGEGVFGKHDDIDEYISDAVTGTVGVLRAGYIVTDSTMGGVAIGLRVDSMRLLGAAIDATVWSNSVMLTLGVQTY